ncbi:hypothetical protein MKW94_026318 [Papaver nudicaule]|uniref:Uncharacterized protein n=1 Tax=Papaver nudicaule TaxID=74823 RepID=A0AA41V638_PAPNU|nr:hypothetical protein [Papaver nudicaule]MCL7048342.1 hypothetical protein [Papaver nudicaule]
MDSASMLCFLLGCTASIFFYLPHLKKWQKKQSVEEKLRILGDALEHAELRLIRFQERHDRLLNQLCSYYLCNQELEKSLVNARTSMNESLEFTNTLRQMQLKLIQSYPGEFSDIFQLDRPNRVLSSRN